VGVGGCLLHWVLWEQTYYITRLLSISNPNMLWSCNLSHTSQAMFLWLIGMQWSFRASQPHTQKLIDIEIWLCKWASCLLLLVLCFVLFCFVFFFWVRALAHPPFDSPFCSDFTWFVCCCGHMFPWELLHLECGCVWERFSIYTDFILFYFIFQFAK
jgi:hypothetical protein